MLYDVFINSNISYLNLNVLIIVYEKLLSKCGEIKLYAKTITLPGYNGREKFYAALFLEGITLL